MEVNAGRVQRYTQRLGRRRAQVDYISRCTNEDCEKGDKKACCESGDPSEFRSCVNVEVAVWAPVPNKPTVSVDLKQHSTNQTSSDVTHIQQRSKPHTAAETKPLTVTVAWLASNWLASNYKVHKILQLYITF